MNSLNFNITLDQSSLVEDYNVPIPVELQYDFVKLKIKCPNDLDEKTIEFVAKTALEAAIYTHVGFGISENGKQRSTDLKDRFKQLDTKEIEFKIYASTYGRGKNIAYPFSFSNSSLRA